MESSTSSAEKIRILLSHCLSLPKLFFSVFPPIGVPCFLGISSILFDLVQSQGHLFGDKMSRAKHSAEKKHVADFPGFCLGSCFLQLLTMSFAFLGCPTERGCLQ